jgi:transketolase
MHLDASTQASGDLSLTSIVGPVRTERAPSRRKGVQYDPALLPRLDPQKEYAASDIVTAAMKVFARDASVVSIDADLATTSGLEAGVAAVDQRRALNVGVAEANMMGIGEASPRSGIRPGSARSVRSSTGKSCAGSLWATRSASRPSRRRTAG